MTTIIRKRHVWEQRWDNPRFSILMQPGTSTIMTDRYARTGNIGVMTHLGALWVAAGPNGDLFYYNFIIDGELREKILRIIGNAPGTSTTGVPTPVPLTPPEVFHNHMQIICFNNDTVAHQAEIFAAGYNIMRRPDV